MKFKVIPQLSEEDCAAACVCMIAKNYFQKNISLCEIRPIIKNTQAGTSYGDIQIGLTKLGINSKIYEAEKSLLAFSEMSFPVITQRVNSDNTFHYLVIYKCTNKYIYYADPAYTVIKKMNYDEFISCWVPYVIQIDVASSQIKLDIDENLEKLSYLNLFLKIKGRVVLVTIFSVLIYLLGIFLANMYNTYFSVIIPEKLVGSIFYVMLVFLASVFIKLGLSFFTTIVTNSLNKSLDTILSQVQTPV